MYIANVLSTEYGVKYPEREVVARKGTIYKEKIILMHDYKINQPVIFFYHVIVNNKLKPFQLSKQFVGSVRWWRFGRSKLTHIGICQHQLCST